MIHLFARSIFFALLLAAPLCAEAPLDLSPLRKWFAKQDEVHSIAADFVQTRSLKVLRDPVATPGRLWFVPPSSLRWEIGNPAKTIVLRQGETYLIVMPAKKKAERHPANSMSMALPRFPLAKSFADFQRQFDVLALTTSGERCHTELAPRDSQARKFLTALRLDFNSTSGHLLAFEMALRDGSSMRNEFSNVRVNQKIDRAIFRYDLTGYEVKDAHD